MTIAEQIKKGINDWCVKHNSMPEIIYLGRSEWAELKKEVRHTATIIDYDAIEKKTEFWGITVELVNQDRYFEVGRRKLMFS